MKSLDTHLFPQHVQEMTSRGQQEVRIRLRRLENYCAADIATHKRTQGSPRILQVSKSRQVTNCTRK